MRSDHVNYLRRLPISFGMALRLREKCKKVAAELKDKTSLFVLGKGYGEPIGKRRSAESDVAWQ